MRAPPEVVAAAQVDVAERLEIRDRAGPIPDRCVEVKPRKSSAVSGIRSAPLIPAATAIRFGSERPPSKPPPANPRRIDVTSSDDRRAEPVDRVVDVLERVRAQQDRRRRFARAPCRRVAREAERVDERAACPARRSHGRCRAHAAGTSRSKYGSPHATVTPRPAGDGRVVARRASASARSSVRCASREVAAVDGGRARSRSRGGAAARAPPPLRGPRRARRRAGAAPACSCAASARAGDSPASRSTSS